MRLSRNNSAKAIVFLFDLVSGTTTGIRVVETVFLIDGVPMKQVVVIVKPFLAERVLETVAELQVDALAVHEVKGYGRQKSYLDATTEQDRSLAFLPKVEIQCWVEDSQIDRFIDNVSQVARTGRMGDGKIFILPVSQVSE